MLYLGDCLEEMKKIESGSVDMVMCDLPYGTTSCKWDIIIPLDRLWIEYRRIVKSKGAIVLTASQPFTTLLISSNLKEFRHSWVWNKLSAANVMAAKHGPLKIHEDIIIFARESGFYKPQMIKGKPRWKGGNNREDGIYSGGVPAKKYWCDNYYPKSIIEFSNASHKNKVHPTQKPVTLLEYLIRTYTNEGDTVLDNAMGSGSTGIACANTGRKFIGIEKDSIYFAIAERRIAEAQSLAVAAE